MSRNSYNLFSKAYTKENFFVSYAIRPPIYKGPIPGPVHQPSPLNSTYQFGSPNYDLIPIPCWLNGQVIYDLSCKDCEYLKGKCMST